MRIRRPFEQGTQAVLAIDGLDLGSLVAIELFTTVVPILLLAYAWSRLGRLARVGQLFVSELQIGGKQAATVLDEFGTAAELHQRGRWRACSASSPGGYRCRSGRAFSLAWQRPMHACSPHLARHRLVPALLLLFTPRPPRLHRRQRPANLEVLTLIPAILVSTVFWGAYAPILLISSGFAGRGARCSPPVCRVQWWWRSYAASSQASWCRCCCRDGTASRDPASRSR